MRLLAKALLPYSLVRLSLEIYGFASNPEMKNDTKKNRGLKGRYSGSRCFILGNGPSLRQEALGRLSEEIVFTCNNIGKSDLIDSITPFAHFIMDARMVEGSNASIRRARIAENVRRLKRRNTCPMLFLGYGLKDFAIETGLEGEFTTHYIYQSRYRYDVNYAPDLCRSVPGLPTVVQTEILAAVYMGFSEIYLLGCDCTGFITIADAMSKETSSQMAYAYKTDAVDKMIVSHAVSQNTASEQLFSYAELFANYELLGDYCKKHGVKLVNLSSGGILNELPRARLEDIVPGVSKKEADD